MFYILIYKNIIKQAKTFKFVFNKKKIKFEGKNVLTFIRNLKKEQFSSC